MSDMRPLLVETASRVMRDRTAFTPALWQALEEAGLPGAALAEAMGGAGADWADAMAILRAAGRDALPAPLAETMLAQWLFAESGLTPPPGALTLAPVANERLTLARTRDGWRIEGFARAVPWAREAAAVAVLAQDGGRTLVAAVPAGAARLAPGTNLADEPRDDVTFATELPAHAVAESAAGADAVFRRGAVARAAQMAGALETVLELTVRYCGERVQFGRPIGKFQAIQQQVAELATEVAAASVAADAAAATPDDEFAVAIGKARVSMACAPAAAIAHQVHGAMGFAREHRLNLFTRRLWSWRDEFGDEAHWWRVLGQAAARAGGDGLWPIIAGRAP